MSYVLRQYENHVALVMQDNSNVITHLTPQIYKLTVVDQQLRLLKSDIKFKLPKTLYGRRFKEASELIINSYRSQEKSTGALLLGSKGTGKTLLMKLISNVLLSLEHPVIIVDNMVSGHDLSLLLHVVGPCVVLFDEFIKVYHNKTIQESLLPVLDNPNLPKCLFIASDNKIEGLSEFFYNRPGRFLFRIELQGVDNDVLEALLSEYNIDKHITDEIKHYLLNQKEVMSFDIIKTVLESSIGIKTTEEFANRLLMLNVPKRVYKKAKLLTPFNERSGFTYSALVRKDGKVTVSEYDQGKHVGGKVVDFVANGDDVVFILNGNKLMLTTVNADNYPGDEYEIVGDDK